mmetsp:Transcript_52769/g.98822  ORF Transcript_52769/g.98822 Transcript_52769/m.98822 type:complete len:171 (-) Transcript_52769:190-702(-)
MKFFLALLTFATTTRSAESQARYIEIINFCKQAVWAAVVFKNTNGEWIAGCGFDLAPNSHISLTDAVTTEPSWWFYVEGTETSVGWTGVDGSTDSYGYGDREETCGGNTLNFREQNFVHEGHFVAFSCPDGKKSNLGTQGLKQVNASFSSAKIIEKSAPLGTGQDSTLYP